MIRIQVEKQDDGVWLGIDNCDWLISREAFTALVRGLEQFDHSQDTVKQIYLDLADDDRDPFEEVETESPDYSYTGDASAKRLGR